MTPRIAFGALALVITGAIVALTLSPFVQADKEKIALIVLGNVLSWPVIVLQFYFGSSDGSKEKTDLMAHRPDGTPTDPIHTEENEKGSHYA